MQRQIQEPDSENVLLSALAAGYGYPNGQGSMPTGLGKTCLKLYHAMLMADRPMLEQILHPDNKRSREAFASLSAEGKLALPRTVKGTNEVIAGVVDLLRQSYANAGMSHCQQGG